MRSELCVLDLDQPPATSLSRLHSLWGVEGEEAAEAQLESFAECGGLSAVQRSLALGMRDTAERRQYARRCRLKANKRALAESALEAALASFKCAE